MFKLTLASFVNIALLHIIFVKFGSFTPPTEFPTDTTSVITALTTTTRINDLTTTSIINNVTTTKKTTTTVAKNNDFTCPENTVICPGSLCIERHLQCPGGEDEQDWKDFTCPENTVICPGSLCIERHLQCPGGEDEQDWSCTPDFINVTISDDLPKNDNSTKVQFMCNNWNSISVYFRLDIKYNEHRYFSTEYSSERNLKYLILTIKNTLYINTWNTTVTVLNEPYRNETINEVPIMINVIEMNDRPTIQPHYLETQVREDVPVGTIVANFSISDPDDGIFGEVQAELRSQGDINEWFEVVNITKDIIQIRTASVLDADRNLDRVNDYIERARGPTFTFDVKVKDGGGLSYHSIFGITIIDIGDIIPVCNHHTLKNETHRTKKDAIVTSLDRFCRARNYISAVDFFQEVAYSLISDSCNLFNITYNRMVQLQDEVPNDITNCTLSVRASDKAFPTLNTTFALLIEFTRCLSDTDYNNIQWDTGIPGQTTWHKCPAGYIGQVSRYCSKSGVYQDPVYNCTKSSIDNIYKKLIEDTKTGKVDIVEVLDDLSNATTATDENSTLFIGDIDTAINTLAKIVDVVTVNTTNLENITNAYLQTINNILDESTTQTWKVNINQTGSGADAVLKTADSFVEKILTTSKNFTAEISKSNLYLKMGSVQSCNEALNFPEREKEDVPEWAGPRKDKLLIDCKDNVESFSGIMYRNLSMIIPSFTNSTMYEGLQINAPVISFTFYPNIKRDDVGPVEITFQLFNNSLDNARCSFWKESKSETTHGYWSDEGCRLKKYDKDKEVVVCVCDHLTNFAVLMSPSSTPIDEDHRKALSIISMIGCIVSIICLVLSVAIHAFFWRFIKSVRSIIHMNLSCWLIVAYILFLAGINRTENKDVCTAMAILLHLVFLIVFFGMLTEGCNLSYTVLKPLSTRKPGIPLMIASYVIAVIIVVVSMGVSQLHGYGTEQACWLSTDTGLIWAFLVPVLVIALVNLIIVVLVIRTMCGTTAMSKKSSKGRAKAALRCILVLMPLMGLTWGFGALSLNSDTIAFQYLFAFLNSFQGLLIFIFHCVMDKKIKDAFSKQKHKWLQSSQSFGVSEGKRNKTQETSDF
ncbi:adhesion G protein-coupled receptor L3-like isoform X2 [Ruditapes philippinarum]|uniref:adhesion G protein-coupled receptor L3-like isoform X2 n=1 Tax=Ruditapes philippinarum TaxID=129788 RepID=UPI00295AFB2E|nr:adhesion G protein-coupled receptor L3-like isoform X2 [Ruditapes philippinarum]